MKPHTFAYGLPPFLIGTVAAVSIQAQSAVALSIPEINQVAKSITVQIDGPTHGSGVIVKRDGSTYTVLTTAHVVKATGRYTVAASDGNRASVDSSTIKPFAGIDLAILQFKSDRNYPVTEMGDSTKVVEGSLCYVSGFPSKTAAITESIYNFTEGKIRANTPKPLADGYALLYSNDTLPGMSGGPVLDEQGRLIGIHGRADTSNRGQASDINSNIVVKTGFNLGIPIHTFLSAVAKVDPSFTVGKVSSSAASPKPPVDNDYRQVGNKSDKRDDKSALADLNRIIALNPRDAEAYVRRGATYVGLKNYRKAEADYDKAIEIDPEYRYAYFIRGAFYTGLEDYSRAVANFTKAIFISPLYPEVFYSRGNAFMQLKQYTRAILDYDRAISDNPDYADAYFMRGLTYWLRGDKQQGIQDVQTSAKIYRNQGSNAGYNKAIKVLQHM
jgi:Trypsin-like peptidase domain/TPR repeat/Tetratricopeptide repeat